MADGTTFQLTFDFSESDVRHIRGLNYNVALVKSASASHGPGGDNHEVIWLDFAPFMTNTVTWQEHYAVYASNTRIEDGATIHKNSHEHAVTGKLYSFTNGHFEKLGKESSGAFWAENQSDLHAHLTMGLAQRAQVDGNPQFSPIIAVPGPKNVKLSFVPEVQIGIFLWYKKDNGTVIAKGTGERLNVTLTTTVNAAKIGFKKSNNTFTLENKYNTGGEALFADPQDEDQALIEA